MNMKNIILKKCAAAALAGGTLLALTACAALPVLTPAPTAPVPASVAAAPTETPTASPVSADIASVLPEPTPEVEAGQEELIALLDAVPFALKLIDWAQNTPLDDDGVKGAVLSWLLNKGNDEQAAFSEQFALTYSAYRTLTSGNETEAADLLDSAGCTDRDASLLPAESLPRAETLKNIIGE